MIKESDDNKSKKNFVFVFSFPIAFITEKKLRFHSRGSGFFGIFSLVLASSFGTSLGPSVEDFLAILVHLQLDDGYFGGMNSDVDGGTISLLPLDTLNVDAELFTVALNNLADLLTLVVASDNLNFVVFTNGNVPESKSSDQEFKIKIVSPPTYLTPYF